MMDFCKIWNSTDVLWKDANWKWPDCQNPNMNFSGIDATTLIPPWQEETPWNPYITSSLNKQKRIIKLICKINNNNYNEQKEVRNINLTIGGVSITNLTKNIDLNLKLEE